MFAVYATDNPKHPTTSAAIKKSRKSEKVSQSKIGENKKVVSL